MLMMKRFLVKYIKKDEEKIQLVDKNEFFYYTKLKIN